MSLIIPPDVLRKFKTACSSEGKEMSEVLRAFIDQYVAEHLPGSHPARKKGGRS